MGQTEASTGQGKKLNASGAALSIGCRGIKIE